MIFIYGLRLVSDLAFYFFFANCIVKSSIWAIIPALFYVVYLIFSKKIDTDWDRQSDFFSKAWKIFLVFGTFVCLTGKGQIFIERSIPMAILCFATSILLMRMLRHEKDIYLDPKYQAKNFLILCITLGVTWILSSRFVLNGLLGSFGFMYNHFVLPILTFIIICLTGIIGLILKLFSWLHLTDITFEESHLTGISTINPFEDTANQIIGQSSSARIVLSAIGIFIILICIFFLFRWLSSRKEIESKFVSGRLVSREELTEKPPERSGSTVNQIRRQYRKYLKLCKMYGIKISTSDTSASIEDQTRKLSSFFPESSEIRDIYIRARYNNHATKSDLRKLKQMYQTIKQKL